MIMIIYQLEKGSRVKLRVFTTPYFMQIMQRIVRSYWSSWLGRVTIYYRQQAPLELNAVTFNVNHSYKNNHINLIIQH